MDEIVKQLETVRRALETLQITSSRNNLDVLLASMQVLDSVIASLKLPARKTEDGKCRNFI